ncbi:DUF4135 domain-containing protein [Roseovarius sp. Pro17]|uniref:DUF4135 domain-containing protein n=1 Tax=Roseovarius sp. Pro17 TaxID=3108175 RepID=UPI002D782306|nr:DUF4135 domain-containing protein [Roseovarius sp. Pro17]
MASIERDIQDDWITGGRKFPFQDAFAGYLAQARKRANWPKRDSVFGPVARRQLEEYLVSRLTFIAARVLGQEFYAFRFRSDISTAFDAIQDARPESFVIYRSFVDQLASLHLDDLLSKYPHLRRHLTDCASQWVAEVGEIETRLRRDIEKLAQKTSIVGPCEQVVQKLLPGLSDPHNHGRAVALLSFRGGGHVIYKPRSVAGEAVFDELVARLNTKSPPARLRSAWVVPGDEYGWMNYMRASEGAARSYAYGCVLALLHVLCATDIHHENVVTVDGQAIPIDLETILNHTTYARLPASRVPSETGDVLHTGFLPRWRTTASGEVYDGSTFGLDLSQLTQVQIWHRLNCDQMTIGQAEHGKGPRLLSRSKAALEADRDAVCSGFEDYYDFILNERQALTSDPQLLAKMDRVCPRALLRDTDTYAAAIRYLLSPSFLMGDQLQNEFFERLKQAWSAQGDGILGEAVGDEIRHLRRLDIPYLTTAHLQTECGIHRSNVFRRQLDSLGKRDRNRQLRSIRDAFSQRFGLQNDGSVEGSRA